MTKEQTNWENEFVEKGAELEHARWSKWQNYLHQKLDFSTGKYVLSESDFEHWNRQIHTPYSELSETEKESDRREVRTYLPLISKLISQEKEKCIKEEVFAFMHHLQDKANTIPPNLLLNEVVNYAYDRVNLIQK